MEETQAVATDLVRHDESSFDGSSTEHGLTARAFVLGLLCVVGIAIAGCYSALLRYDLIGTGHLPRAALWPLLIMVGFGALHKMRRFFWIPYCGFLLVYCITLICQAHVHHLAWKSAWVVVWFAVLFGIRECLLAYRKDDSGPAALLIAFTQSFCVLHCAAALIASRYLAVPWWLWCNGILIGISAEELRVGIVNGKSQNRRPFTVESVLLAIISTGGIVAIVATFSKHLPSSAALLLLYLLGVHSFVQLLRTRFNLTRTEKLFAYCMILVSCAIPGQQMATYIYLGMLGPIYYATPQNRFQEIYFHYLRPWIVPSKDPNSPIVRWAFEGIPGGGSVPMMIWKAWVLPVLLWMPLILAIFFVTVCLAALLRKQWVDRERLLFPLAEVPLEVTEAPEDSVGPPLFANWMFWACFLLPTVLYTYRALHQYWPSIPDVNLYRSTENLFSTRPWNTLNWVPMNYYFDMIGITYLLTTEMGFSFWFFYFLRRITVLVRTAFGMEDHYRFMDLQGQGALIVLGLFYLWVMRHHLWEVVRKGLLHDRTIDDSHEPISYRFAFWGVVGGMAVIVGWCYAIGMPVGWAIALFAVYFGGHLVLTRLVSEAGLFVYWLPAPQMTLINLFGNHLFSNQSLTSLQVVGWKLQDSASSILPNALQGFKVADRSRMNQTSLFVAMMAAIVIAVFACHIPSISVIYRTTVPHLGWWPKGATRALPNQIVNSIINPDPYKSGDFANMGLGAVVAGFLLYMRQRFLWWPFHPLGYIGSYSTWFGDRYAWSIFIGWWAKVIVLKAGGATAWRKCRPAALGLIIGNCFVLFLWLLLQLIWPVQQVLVIE